MTNRDPYTDPTASVAPGRKSNPRPYTDRSRDGGWSIGAILGTIIAVAVIVAAIAYNMNRGSAPTARGPSITSTSAPSTTGQGGTTGGSTAPAGPAQ